MNADDPIVSKPSATVQTLNEPTNPEISREVQALGRLVNVILVGLLFLSFAVNAFIWRQMSLVRRQLAQNEAVEGEYRRSTEPFLNELVGRMQGFAAQNPDFQPILNRYVPRTGSAPATGVVPEAAGGIQTRPPQR